MPFRAAPTLTFIPVLTSVFKATVSVAAHHVTYLGETNHSRAKATPRSSLRAVSAPQQSTADDTKSMAEPHLLALPEDLHPSLPDHGNGVFMID